MAKHIVEYKLHGNKVPHFIEDGGYFIDSSDPHTKIGVTRDSVRYYVPLVELTVLTNAQLIDRVVGLNIKDITKTDPRDRSLPYPFTDSEKTDKAINWLEERGF